jgi:hypothetical protein
MFARLGRVPTSQRERMTPSRAATVDMIRQVMMAAANPFTYLDAYVLLWIGTASLFEQGQTFWYSCLVGSQ